ncbi:PilZ domain-containing protein [Occallatibacter savannae]|uniref:Abi-alpha family protein n=1 Tax=Occallatibacter savannae TaxID=1002691 RepID=UPI000D699103|nr:PilZ domain-containing protein [Occallatibacter savannae]
MANSNSRFDGHSTGQDRRAERRNAPALAAYHWKGPYPRLNSVRDISCTGAFLLTQERWEPGEVVSLTLQRSGPPEKENAFSVQAKAVRWDNDGVAVSFLLPPGADLRLWQSPLKSAELQNEPEDILREFRVAQTISFLSRISPETRVAVSRLLHEELSNYRLENAIEIARKAERMLGAAVEEDHLRALPEIAMRILEAGSWSSDDKWMLQFWAGLLAASCSSTGDDQSIVAFVDLLSQLKMLHMRILSAAAAKSSKVSGAQGTMYTRPLKWNAADLVRFSGSADLIKLDRELNYMADIGLIAPREKSAFFQQMTDTTIALTNLGLQLYARCNGHRGTAQNFYGVPMTPSGALALEK